MIAKFILPLATAAVYSPPALAQDLTGTLKKIKDTGTITLGHRDRRCRSLITTTSSR
jgi:hypothetical protein